jgi:hypothetical protein
MQTKRLLASIGALTTALTASALWAVPAQAAVTNVGKIVQEPTSSGMEARFPDIVKLNDGRLMAVWYKATEHQGTNGTIQVSYGTNVNGTYQWTAEHSALAHPGLMNGKDTRDPKLGLMNDGTVLLQYFIPGGGIWYAMWKPGWNYFDDPKQIVIPGLGALPAEHGGILALAGSSEVLIPFYTGASAYFARATYDSTLADKLDVHDYFPLALGTTGPAGGLDDQFYEPSFVQYGNTIVAVVRHQTTPHGSSTASGAPALVVTWDVTAATPTFTTSYWDVPAISHHLLKTSDGRLLFTFGDTRVANRPTEGTMIANPTQLPWKKQSEGQKVIGIYNSGAADQANPSSVEPTPGTFFTLGYNAKKYGPTEGPGVSPSGGTLWILQSHYSDY